MGMIQAKHPINSWVQFNLWDSSVNKWTWSTSQYAKTIQTPSKWLTVMSFPEYYPPDTLGSSSIDELEESIEVSPAVTPSVSYPPSWTLPSSLIWGKTKVADLAAWSLTPARLAPFCSECPNCDRLSTKCHFVCATVHFKSSFEGALAETKVLCAFMQSSQSAKPVILRGPIMT